MNRILWSRPRMQLEVRLSSSSGPSRQQYPSYLKSASRTYGLQRIGTNLDRCQFNKIVRQLYGTLFHYLKSRRGDWAGNYKCLEDILLFNDSCQRGLDRWYDALDNSDNSLSFNVREDGKVLQWGEWTEWSSFELSYQKVTTVTYQGIAIAGVNVSLDCQELDKS